MAAQDLSISIVAIDKTTAAFRAVQSGLGNITSSAASVTSKIGAVTAALTTLGGAATIRNVVAVADSLDQLSARSGIAVQTLSSLANTARFTGVSQDELAGALVRLNRAIAEAASGSKEQIQVFQNLGVSFKNADGSIRPVVDVLGDVASAFSGAENNAIKTQYAMALFGKSGANLIEFLDRGKTGIQDVSATIDEDFAKAAGTFNDNLDTMSLRVQGFLGQKLGPFLQFINRELQRVNDIDAEIKRAASGKISTQADVRKIDNALMASGGPKGSLRALAAPKTGPSDAEKEAARLLEETRRAYQSISDEITKLVSGEDELALIQFQRITNDARAVENYKAMLAERRKLLNLDLELEEASKQADKLADAAAEKKKKTLEEVKTLYEQTRTPLENFNIEMARLDELLAKGYIGWDVYSRATLDALDKLDMFKEKGKDTFEDLKDAIRGWGTEFTNVMTDSVMTGKFQFKDLASSIIRDLIRIQIQKSITDPLIKAGSSFLDSFISGKREMGGPVTGGRSYLVGENGPEIFTPAGSGSIIPNGQDSSSVTVNQVINVTTGVQQTVRAEIMTLMPQIAGAAKAAVADAKLRGGSYAAALR